MSVARVFFPIWLLVFATYVEARQYETHVTVCMNGEIVRNDR